MKRRLRPLARGIACAALALAAAAAANARLGADVRQPSRPLPGVETVKDAIREHFRLDPVRESKFTYLETRRRMKHDGNGPAEVIEEKVYEVYPDQPVGRLYRRLIRRNGVPVPPAELAKQDADRRRDLERRARETPVERARRIRKHAEKLRENQEELEDALRVWHVRLTGYERLGPRTLLAAELTPRPDARVRTRLGKYLRSVKGRAWMTPDDFQLVRAELEVVRPINIGLGLVGRVHKGGRAVLERTLVDGTWMLTLARLEASGRAFLVKPVSIDAVYEYSRFRRVDEPASARRTTR